MSPTTTRMGIVLLTLALLPTSVEAQFTYRPAGEVIRRRDGSGRLDGFVYIERPMMSEVDFVPDMRFPIASGPAYANSQVFAYGGGQTILPDLYQGHVSNFSYPWRDTFCEAAHNGSGSNPLCGAGSSAHGGVDIRGSSARAGVHVAVAALPGSVTSVRPVTLTLVADDGTMFSYLHMSDRVGVGRVGCGAPVGRLSNFSGIGRSCPSGRCTTVHLHFEVREAVRGRGVIPVPPYTSLVHAYQRLLSGSTRCTTSDAGVPMGNDAGMAMRSDTGVTMPSDAGVVPVRPDAGAPRLDAGTDAGVGSCVSTVLGRPVPSGTCVQRTPELGCDWYECVSGVWAVRTAEQCLFEVTSGDTEESTTYPHAMCPAWEDPCASDGLTCDSCTGRTGCGFCGDDDTCRSDFLEGTCEDWRDAWFECVECDTITDCTECAVNGCGWCASSSQCMTARSGGGPLRPCADWHYTDTLAWCEANP